jgi:acyl-CoA thioester hydrolase
MAQRFTTDRLDPAAYPAPGIDLPVLYGNLDTNGHLNNVELGRFFEHARATTWAPVSFWKAVHQGGGLSVVVRVSIDYLAEVRIPATLHLRTRMARIGTASAVVEQGAWVGDRCIGLAEVTFVHSVHGASAPWPDEARAILEGLLAWAEDPALS